MDMWKGSTPTLAFKFPFKVNTINALTFKCKQGDTVKISKSLSDFSTSGEDILYILLTQADTLALASEEYVTIQFKVQFTNNHVVPSSKMILPVQDVIDTVAMAGTATAELPSMSLNVPFPQVDGGFSVVMGMAVSSGGITSVAWSDITGKPETFPPSSHTHTKSEITDFPTLATVATSGNYGDLSNKPSIPTKTTDLTNDSGFITNAVNDLTNYYIKTGTYSKEEVNALISTVKQFTYEVVSVLPTASASTMNKIYLIPSSSSAVSNVKDEYITIDGGVSASPRYSWEQIGSTSIDLSAYRTSAAQDVIDATLQPKSDNALSTTSKTVTGAINELKQKVLPDATENGTVAVFYDDEWHIQEGYGYSYVGEKTFLNKTLYASSFEEGTDVYWVTISGALKITQGKAYTVTWDGVEYECESYVDEWGYINLGNSSIWDTDAEDTGEPFCFYDNLEDDECYFGVAGEPQNDIEVSIVGNAVIYNKIDDNLVFPSATENGTVAVYIDGEWKSQSGYGYSYTSEGTIFDRTISASSFQQANAIEGVYYCEIDSQLSIVSEKTYTVTLNGVEYERESCLFGETFCIGNMSLAEPELEDTGEPFFILMANAPYYGIISLNEQPQEDVEINISVSVYAVQQFDASLLPISGKLDNPEDGEEGQVLTYSEDGIVWDYVSGLPDGGTVGQVVTKTANGAGWGNIPSELPTASTDGSITVYNDGSWTAQTGYGYSDTISNGTLVDKYLYGFRTIATNKYATFGLTKPLLSITQGKTYSVKWGDTTYSCTAVVLDNGYADYNGIAFGNLSIINKGSDTGEPFLYTTSYPISVNSLSVAFRDVWIKSTDSSIMVKVTGEGIINIPIESSLLSNGNITNGNGGYSVIQGIDNSASGGCSHAAGVGTQAGGICSHSEGYFTKANAEFAHAEGSMTTAIGSCSHAEGLSTYASQIVSHAEGYGTKATGMFAHAEGYGTEANGESQHVSGKFNVKNASNAFVVGNGSGDLNNQRSDAFNVDWYGNAWLAGDVYVGSTSGRYKDAGSVKLQKVSDNTLTTSSKNIVGAINELATNILTNAEIDDIWEGDE